MSDTLGIYQLGPYAAQSLPDATTIQSPAPSPNPLNIPTGREVPLNAFGYPDILLGSPNASLMLFLIQSRNLYDSTAHIVPTHNQIQGQHLDILDTRPHH